MKKDRNIYLLPYRFQWAGWAIAAVSLMFMAVSYFFGFEAANLVRCQIYGLLVLYLGLLLIGFSREKQEDEFTLHLRTSSALIAMLAIFVLSILLSLIIPFLQSNEGPDNIGQTVFREVTDTVTSPGFAFVVYLLLYKIRLARYNRESIKDTAYEE